MNVRAHTGPQSTQVQKTQYREGEADPLRARVFMQSKNKFFSA